MSKPHAIVIGAGFTGTAIAHDLALRSFRVTVIERGPIANGASGRTHGLLHSGARYAVKDQESAAECIEENAILRRIVPGVIEQNGGLFVAITEEDQTYKDVFLQSCVSCGIPVDELTPQEALRLEPNLNPRLLAAVLVPDGTFDPLRLALSFAATAKKNGANFRLFSEVTGLLLDGKGNVTGVRVNELTSGAHIDIQADVVINATGAWVGQITQMAHVHVPVRPTPGIMVAYDQRLVNRAINRLHKPGDGDIVLPQRRMVVVGTTSFPIDNADYVPIDRQQVTHMLQSGAELIPAIRQARERGVYMATRPLIGGSGEGRSISRTFKVFDHKELENVDGLVTITGGKATTCRVMAEKTVDIVCQKLGLNSSCSTAEIPLASYREFYL